MPEFMDVHRGGGEGVDFKHAWADPESGLVWCLSEAPDADAADRYTRNGLPREGPFRVPCAPNAAARP